MTETVVNYQLISELFSKSATFKGLNIQFAEILFKKNHQKLGLIWGRSRKNNRDGLLFPENQEWHPYNRINTNSGVIAFFFNKFIEKNGDTFKDLRDHHNHKHNLQKLWEYVDEDIDFLFSKENLNTINLILKKSWLSGVITTIFAVLYIHKIFENSKIRFSFNMGENQDFMGVDLIVNTKDNNQFTVQCKSGSFKFDGDTYFIKGSQNDFNYDVDYYSYANDVSIILFKNPKVKPSTIRDEDSEFKIDKQFVEHNPFVKYMLLPNDLREVISFCGENGIDFTIESNEENINDVVYDSGKKTLTVNLSDLSNEESTNEISKKLISKLSEIRGSLSLNL